MDVRVRCHYWEVSIILKKSIDFLFYIISILRHSLNVLFGFKIVYICTSVFLTMINIDIIIMIEFILIKKI